MKSFHCFNRGWQTFVLFKVFRRAGSFANHNYFSRRLRLCLGFFSDYLVLFLMGWFMVNIPRNCKETIWAWNMGQVILVNCWNGKRWNISLIIQNCNTVFSAKFPLNPANTGETISILRVIFYSTRKWPACPPPVSRTPTFSWHRKALRSLGLK